MSLKDDFTRTEEGMWPGTNRGCKILIGLFATVAVLSGGLIGILVPGIHSVPGRVGLGFGSCIGTFFSLMAFVCAQNPE